MQLLLNMLALTTKGLFGYSNGYAPSIVPIEGIILHHNLTTVVTVVGDEIRHYYYDYTKGQAVYRFIQYAGTIDLLVANRENITMYSEGKLYTRYRDQSWIELPSDKPIKALTMGYMDTGVQYEDSTIAYYTKTEMGKLPSIPIAVQSLACGGSHIIINTAMGLYGFGLNASGQLGIGTKTMYANTWIEIPLDEPALIISCGFDYTFVYTGGLYACGTNAQGQLGVGDSPRQTVLTKLDFDHLVIAIACSITYTMIYTDNDVYACGTGPEGISKTLVRFNSSYPIIAPIQPRFNRTKSARN